MSRFSPLGHAALAAALAVPVMARAADGPPAAPAVVDAPAPVPMPRDHKHFGRVAKGLVPCEKCAAQARKAQAEAASPVRPTVTVAAPMGRARRNPAPIPTAGFPEGSRIVGCAHSSNGVCASCKALLEMPGEVVAVAPGMASMPGPTAAVASASASAAPGRAVATDAEPGHAMVAAGEPEPIGVMQTNYTVTAPPGPAARPAQPAMPPEPGRGPYLGGTSDTHPHIIEHLFGISAMQRDFHDKMEEKDRKKRQKHSAVSYDSTDGKVQELPASMVFGRNAPR